MKELRLTFRTDDFGTISQILIDRGISFQVEPAGAAAEAAPVREKAPAGRPRGAAARPKKARKKRARTPDRPEKPAAGALPLAGAERLREALGQGKAAASPLMPPAARPGSDEPTPGGRG